MKYTKNTLFSDGKDVGANSVKTNIFIYFNSSALFGHTEPDWQKVTTYFQSKVYVKLETLKCRQKNETKQDNDFIVILPHLCLLLNPLHKGLTGDTNKLEGTADRLNRLKMFQEVLCSPSG